MLATAVQLYTLSATAAAGLQTCIALPPVTDGSRIVFIGDSKMKFTFSANLERQHCSHPRVGGRCREEYVFMRVDEPGDFPPSWWQSNSVLPGMSEYLKTDTICNLSDSMGPDLFGFENHGCHDCRGCSSRERLCHNGTHSVFTTYLRAEYARDCEVQTRKLKTTQEVIFRKYL